MEGTPFRRRQSKKPRSKEYTNLYLQLDILNLTFDFISPINLKKQQCPNLRRHVKYLLEQAKNNEKDLYLYFEPKSLRYP